MISELGQVWAATRMVRGAARSPGWEVRPAVTAEPERAVTAPPAARRPRTSASPERSVRAALGQLAQARTEAPTAVVAPAAVTTVVGAVKAEPAPTSDARPPEVAAGALAS